MRGNSDSMRVNDGLIDGELCGLRTGGCADRVFVLRQMTEKTCGRVRKVHMAVLDFEKSV